MSGATERSEELIGPPGCERALRVRATAPAGERAVRAEQTLLAALEVAGINAAPCVLEVEADGYVRETAPPLRRRQGRRVAAATDPATAEREASRQIRAELEELLKALHERGWVLGAAPGGGIGVRAEGSVLVTDLRGLRESSSVRAQLEDRRWIDSVLGDQDRTLRRRIHDRGPDPDVLVAPIPEAPHLQQSDADHGEESQLRPLPQPRTASRSARRTGSGATAAVRRVLADPVYRRTAVLSALVVLALAVAGGGTWWVLRDPAVSIAAPPAPASRGASTPDAEPVPAINDPWALAAELAGARHAYVTGLADVSPALPGSVAASDDEAVRTAYEGATVRGGGPVIHEAELIQAPDAQGRAVIAAVTSTEEHTVITAADHERIVPATQPASVRIELIWDHDQWRIVEVSPASS